MTTNNSVGKEKYWEGFDFALNLIEEMYGKNNFQHDYNIVDCVRCKVNRLDKSKIRKQQPLPLSAKGVEEKTILKPCPFCGGEAKMEQFHKYGFEIKCTLCAIKYKQKVLYKSLEWLQEKMIANWNTRMSEELIKENEAGWKIANALQKQINTLQQQLKEKDEKIESMELEVHKLSHQVKLYEGASDEWRTIVEKKRNEIFQLQQLLSEKEKEIESLKNRKPTS